MATEYSEKLKDPRWQKKRLEILVRDEWTCQKCDDKTSMLVVHHKDYLDNVEPWDYPEELLIALCDDCHEEELVNNDFYSSISHAIRNHFLTYDICTIEYELSHLNLKNSDRTIFAETLCWIMESPELQQELMGRYIKMTQCEVKYAQRR